MPPKTDTWIDINTFDVPMAEFKQLGYLHRLGEYSNSQQKRFSYTKYMAASAIGLEVPSNCNMVKVCYTFYPVDEE